MQQYQFTDDLVTGNKTIDDQHKRLIQATNDLMSACSQGKGRDNILSTSAFLKNYVKEHFADEERLQVESNYPDLSKHRIFHSGYRAKLSTLLLSIEKEGANIVTLSKLNEAIGLLINHIRSEDKRVAQHIQSTQDL